VTGELVAALIIRERKLLLVHNTKQGFRVEPPGGKVHEGEGREEALRREVEEETGLKVGGLTLFGEFKTTSPEGAFIVHMYLCKEAEGEPSAMEPGKISGVGWYGFKELKALEKDGALVPNMRAALGRLEEYLRQWPCGTEKR